MLKFRSWWSNSIAEPQLLKLQKLKSLKLFSPRNLADPSCPRSSNSLYHYCIYNDCKKLIKNYSSFIFRHFWCTNRICRGTARTIGCYEEADWWSRQESTQKKSNRKHSHWWEFPQHCLLSCSYHDHCCQLLCFLESLSCNC